MTSASISEWTPARVIERLEAARRALEPGRRALIAFDGDGTLWGGDIGDEIFEALLARRAIRAEARLPLAREQEAHGVPAESLDPHDVAAALFAAYRAGRYPEDRVFAMMAWVFAGHTEEEAARFAEETLRDKPVDGRLHDGVPPILEWAAEAGVEAWIVSASPRHAVVAAAVALGIGPQHVCAMTPTVEGGRLGPRIDGEIVYGEGKRVALTRARPDAAWLGVFGDSGWDASMMKHAAVPVAIDPKPSLLARAAELPGLVRLAGRHAGARVTIGERSAT